MGITEPDVVAESELTPAELAEAIKCGTAYGIDIPKTPNGYLVHVEQEWLEQHRARLRGTVAS